MSLYITSDSAMLASWTAQSATDRVHNTKPTQLLLTEPQPFDDKFRSGGFFVTVLALTEKSNIYFNIFKNSKRWEPYQIT